MDKDTETLQAENERLQQELNSVRASQSGSDKRVSELTKQLEQKQENESEKVVAEKERNLDRREKALNIAVERGLDPKTVFSLLGLDDETTDEDRIDAIAGIKQNAKNDLLRENGVKPHETIKLKFDVMPPSQYNALSDDQLEGLPPEEHNKIIDKAIEAEKQKRSGGSLRARLSRAFGGGE